MNIIDNNNIWLLSHYTAVKPVREFFAKSGLPVTIYRAIDQNHYNSLTTQEAKDGYIALVDNNPYPQGSNAISYDFRIPESKKDYKLIGSIRNPYTSFVTEWRRETLQGAKSIFELISKKQDLPPSVRGTDSPTIGNPKSLLRKTFREWIDKTFDDLTSPGTLNPLTYSPLRKSKVANMAYFLNQQNRDLDYIIRYENFKEDLLSLPFVDSNSDAIKDAKSKVLDSIFENSLEQLEYLKIITFVDILNGGDHINADKLASRRAQITELLGKLPTNKYPDHKDYFRFIFEDGIEENIRVFFSKHKGLFNVKDALSLEELYPADWRNLYTEKEANLVYGLFEDCFTKFNYSKDSWKNS